MAFPSKPGCPLCGIVSRAASATGPASPLVSPRPDSPSLTTINSASPSITTFAGAGASSSTRRGKRRADDEPEILWQDEHFTVYRERAHPVSSIAHLVIIFNLHVPSLYMLSSSDIPLLVQLRELAHRFLSQLTTIAGRSSSSPSARPSFSTPPASPLPSSSTLAPQPTSTTQTEINDRFRIGFISPPWKDTQLPVKDHLHAHAYVAPMDRCGWWRSIAYSPLAWYAVDDLIAEIREESTNNRIRSDGNGTESRRPRLIDRIPAAGARSGTADGHETTREGISLDLEADGTRKHARGGRESTGSGGTSASGSGRGSVYGRSPVAAPSPARLAAPSHLDLNAPLVVSGSGSGVGSSSAATIATPSTSTSTPTRNSFGFTPVPTVPTRGSSPAAGGGGGESRPGSSTAASGQLLSPAFPPS
ncbi:uncharacterized protein FOMMEDRAFT_19565 [Fomitiporia mediterranea MF3/22]|uniref:uncharacterized protein n=1 Tax=Fomitiporia mediterranea (strain MF3/22) TaxID=694068 RepID=UPI0004408D34|nr:uncharacterized protein FOMMEDRAFT_19565 [Fomitiporia mediterranea MF3/22]EJD04300.1 hypothetical protein FOMMEDRAFT_19565 [Fomitiporia mediterranea MF3/22]